MIDKETGEIKELNEEDIENLKELIETSKDKIKKLTEKIIKDETKLKFEKAHYETLIKIFKDYNNQPDLPFEG